MFKSWLIQAEVSALLENQSKTHALEVLGRTKSNSTEAGKTRVHLRFGCSVLILKFLGYFWSRIKGCFSENETHLQKLFKSYCKLNF